MFEKVIFLIEKQKKFCEVSATYLPLGGSLIAQSLMLNLFLSHHRKEVLTVKSLFAGIPYSDMGIRYHFRRLVDDGWVELKPSTEDKRTRLCVPTAKFEAAWKLIFEQMDKQLEG